MSKVEGLLPEDSNPLAASSHLRMQISPKASAALFNAARCFRLSISQFRLLSGGFSGAHVFRIEDENGIPFVVRLTPLEQSLPASRLSLLTQLLEQAAVLGQTGIPVPLSPSIGLLDVPQTEISEVCIGSCVVDGFRVAAEPWMEGHPIDGLPSQHQTYSVIRFLQDFHQRCRASVLSLSRNEWFCLRREPSPGLLRRQQIVKQLFDGGLTRLTQDAAKDSDPAFRALADRACESIRGKQDLLARLLASVTPQSFALQPVLRDLWRPHVLFNGDEVSGLIDLSSAASDHPVTDFARLFRSWFGAHHAAMQTAAATLADTYQLTVSERQLFHALDLCSTLLSPITWIRRRVEARSDQPLPDAIRQRLEELTDLSESYLDIA